MSNALVAQWIEHQTPTLGVTGSTPARRTRIDLQCIVPLRTITYEHGYCRGEEFIGIGLLRAFPDVFFVFRRKMPGDSKQKATGLILFAAELRCFDV